MTPAFALQIFPMAPWCRGGERSPASRPLAALPHAAGEPSADAAGPLRTPKAAARDSGRSGGTGQNRTTGAPLEKYGEMEKYEVFTWLSMC